MDIERMARWSALKRTAARTGKEAGELAVLERQLRFQAPMAWPAGNRKRQHPLAAGYRDRPYPGRIGRLGRLEM